jgi:WD40 repeat protein
VATALGDRTVRLWDVATGAARRTLEGHSEWVSAVAFSPDGKLVASAFVRLGLSVPLYKNDANGEATHLSNPLRRWRKKIDDYRCESKNDLELKSLMGSLIGLRPPHRSRLSI